eukprot:TRINITY_DN1872_c1_g1_i3.p1 TRINITY_DN1872_c1_g1~~TRINITY_DN1872_c1_g1_i3.p1  ORF type:complete len:510 (+),score=122.78 TRINITY_DN1872_c1_g1_i3:55-1584(+)
MGCCQSEFVDESSTIRKRLCPHKLIEKGEIHDYFDFGIEMGIGMTGVVRKVTSFSSNKDYAMKCIEKRKVTKEELPQLRNEVEVLKELDHPNIIRLHASYEDPATIYIVTELCTGGDLFSHLENIKFYSEHEAAKILQSILSAVQYCHTRKISHRDIKLDNFIFTDRSCTHLKLIDFGLSKMFYRNLDSRMESFVGTTNFIPPEMMGTRYNQQCDLWSVGVIAYALLSGLFPFGGASEDMVLKNIEKAAPSFTHERWSETSEGAKDFVSKLLQKDPVKRLSARAALRHEWIVMHMEQEAEPLTNPLSKEIVAALCQFGRESRFKRTAMLAVAQEMSMDETAKLKRAFMAMDTGSSGTITLQEFQGAVSKLLPSQQHDFATTFKLLDQDESGNISWSEFLAATLELRSMVNENSLKVAFNRLDVGKSGKITTEDLRTIISDTVDTDTAQCVFGDPDLEKCGTDGITFESFVAAVKRGAPKSPGRSNVDERKSIVDGNLNLSNSTADSNMV